jgi:hypothetical protein
MMSQITIDRALRNELLIHKYALISAEELSVSSVLESDKKQLWTDWDHLEPDTYLQDGARFRLRRFGLFYFIPNLGEILPLRHAPYFQSAGINEYAGGLQRVFAPLRDATFANPFLHALIKFNFSHFPIDEQKGEEPWKIDMHQFRIVATHEEQGEPTPEGPHHDDDDFNAIHLVHRKNAGGGINTVYDNDLKPLMSDTLQHPLDSVIVWDPHVMHGVTPIHPVNLAEPAMRDVLVLGYNHRPDLARPM